MRRYCAGIPNPEMLRALRAPCTASRDRWKTRSLTITVRSARALVLMICALNAINCLKPSGALALAYRLLTSSARIPGARWHWYLTGALSTCALGYIIRDAARLATQPYICNLRYSPWIQINRQDKYVYGMRCEWRLELMALSIPPRMLYLIRFWTTQGPTTGEKRLIHILIGFFFAWSMGVP
jgi:hypothetical protein